MRHNPLFRIQRRACPYKRGNHQHARPHQIDSPRPSQIRRTNQQRHPTKPSTNPTNTRGPGRGPRGLSQSKITSHSDIVATSSAAIPDGTLFSAQLSPPLPIHSSDTPVTAAVHQFSAVGRIPGLDSQNRIKNQPDQRVSNRGHRQRGKALNRDSYSKKCRSPQDINSRESQWHPTP